MNGRSQVRPDVLSKPEEKTPMQEVFELTIQLTEVREALARDPHNPAHDERFANTVNSYADAYVRAAAEEMEAGYEYDYSGDSMALRVLLRLDALDLMRSEGINQIVAKRSSELAFPRHHTPRFQGKQDAEMFESTKEVVESHRPLAERRVDFAEIAYTHLMERLDQEQDFLFSIETSV